jgi:hypothetical protein
VAAEEQGNKLERAHHTLEETGVREKEKHVVEEMPKVPVNQHGRHDRPPVSFFDNLVQRA